MDSTKWEGIQSQPSYQSLRDIVAERRRRLVVWTGAGVSAVEGLPTWRRLRVELERALEAKLATADISEDERKKKLSSVRAEQNPWIAFERLRDALGAATYPDSIRRALQPTGAASPPSAYAAIWALRPFGLVNLNIDRLATHASGDYVPSSQITEFGGAVLGDYSHVLKSPRSFICNLHGVVENSASWVFTHSELRDLQRSEAYKNFIASILTTCTVLFVGMSVDDTAVGSHLDRLASFGIKSGSHYWITDRRDEATDRWAEQRNVRLVRYAPSTITHPELLAILSDLQSFVPKEVEIAEPVLIRSHTQAREEFPGPDELATRRPNEIRVLLNDRAAEILGDSPAADSYSRFWALCGEYDQAVHGAWYVSTVEGRNQFFGYTLDRLLTEQGAFGAVYEATSPEKEKVAVKLLHGNIRSNESLLQAFRRGVRTMRILSGSGIDGMVSLRDATEIPASIVMDFVEGPNLQEAIKAGQLRSWAQTLEVALKLARTIERAHALPERVLHRDLRPSNIMLRDFWVSGEIDVAVLDFDLSWHQGAIEKSVVYGSTMVGYLAPEQIQTRPKVSTQHTAVDSFGFGMVLFYMLAGVDPVPEQHLHSDWSETVRRATHRLPRSNWYSLPRRVERLVLRATRDHQFERWDMAQLAREVERLHNVESTSNPVDSAELLAEELAARCKNFSDYGWDENALAAVVDRGTGSRFEIQALETERQVRIVLRRTVMDSDDRRRRPEVLRASGENAAIELRKGGLASATFEVVQGMVSVHALASVEELGSRVSDVASAIERGADRMSAAS